MSIRLEMLQVARLAPKLLGESTELVEKFFRSQLNEDGGFKDRTGKSDLYYTVFGLEGLMALQADIPFEKVSNYLRSFGDGRDLDFVHLCCLVRCWSSLKNMVRPLPQEREQQSRARPVQTSFNKSGASILQAAENFSPSPWGEGWGEGERLTLVTRLESFRTPDGGYNPTTKAKAGTAYAAFLALGAYQDLQMEMPDPLRLVQSLKFLETADGAWTNEIPSSEFRVPSLNGSTNATAAAISVLRNLRMPINSAVGDWLLARAHPQGGFLAAPNAPIPDLLSTATALHGLAGLEKDFSAIREPTLDFIDSLWTNEGGFYGHWNDEHLDCEYSYYGLLALGHLSL